jgi:hypothetical protein
MAVGDETETKSNSACADAGQWPAVRFVWLAEELPAGPWPEPLRAAICQALSGIGWDAVQQGEFGLLEILYRDIVSIYPRLLADRSDVDRASDIYMLLYMLLWRRTQKLSELTPFNNDVVRPFTAFLDRLFPKQAAGHSTRTVPRIAYLSETRELFGSNAVARITVSLMLGQQALRDPADWPFLYCLNKPVDHVWDFANDHGLRVRDLDRGSPSLTAEAIIEQLKADEIDILIADNSCAVSTMVMQRRAASVQVFHENGFAPWSIPELDLAILGITPPAPTLFAPGVEMVQTPRNTAFVFQKMARPVEDIVAVRAALRAESGIEEPSVVYGFYGRMAKITDDYMAQVEAILLRDPRAIFFAGGTGRITPLTDCAERSPVGERILIFNDFIDGHVISECIDVFLDTHPFPGGMSCIEVQAHEVPVIWMGPDTQDEQMAIIADQRDPDLKARDAAQYVELAGALADPENRARLGRAALRIAHRFGDMSEQAALVEAHLSAAWARTKETKRIAA